MPDREKVKIGLQCIIDGTVRCASCGYSIDKHGRYGCHQDCAIDALAVLKEQPEIVRCKDCKHGQLIQGEIWCHKYVPRTMIPPDWFCADGERRSNDG